MRSSAALFLLPFLASCTGETETTDSSSSSGQDSSESDTQGMGGGPCGEDGLCEIVVTSAELTGCEGDTGQTGELSATSSAAGTLDVVHLGAADGCCPDFEVTAELNLGDDNLTANYAFTNDFCDCVCSLDVAYTLTEIPTGSYTLMANGTSLPFSVK